MGQFEIGAGPDGIVNELDPGMGRAAVRQEDLLPGTTATVR